MKSDPRKRRGDGRNRWKGPRLGAARPGRSDEGSGRIGGSGRGAIPGHAGGSKRANASDASSFEEGKASSDGGRRPAPRGGSSKRPDAARSGHAGRAHSGSAHSGGSGSRARTSPRNLGGARGTDHGDRARRNDVARKARPEGARGARAAAERQAGKGKDPQPEGREAPSRGGGQGKRPAASPHAAGQRHGPRRAHPSSEPRGSGKRQGARPGRAGTQGKATHGKAGAQGRAGVQGVPARRQQPRSRPSAAARARSRAAAERERRARINRRLGFGALVAVLVVVVVVGMRFVLARISEQDETVTKVPTNDYKPVKCTSELVQTTLTTKGGPAGRPVAFQATLHNTSKSHPCYIDVGWSNLDVSVTSGSAQVASISACHGGAENKRLLLDRGYTATVSLTWNGGTSASGCGNTAKGAKPGTYKAEMKLNDNAAAKAQANFALEQTSPAPSEGQPGQQNPSQPGQQNPSQPGQSSSEGQSPNGDGNAGGGQTPGNSGQNPPGQNPSQPGQQSSGGPGQAPGGGQSTSAPGR